MMSDTKTVKQRWSWRRWLECVESSKLSEAHKAICRRLMEVSRDGGRARRWVANWELDPGASGEYGKAMALAEQLGLAYRQRGSGFYIAVCEDVPAPGSIRLTVKQSYLIADLIDGCGDGADWRLEHINDQSYFGHEGTGIRWRLRAWVTCRNKAVCQRTAASVVKLGLVERDGCGTGWPHQYASTFVFRQYKTYQIAGLARFQTEDDFWLSKEDKKRACEILRRRAQS